MDEHLESPLNSRNSPPLPRSFVTRLLMAGLPVTDAKFWLRVSERLEWRADSEPTRAVFAESSPSTRSPPALGRQNSELLMGRPASVGIAQNHAPQVLAPSLGASRAVAEWNDRQAPGNLALWGNHLSLSCYVRRHLGAWQTASMRCPSGSMTNAA
jgi:hypothetical protein